MSDEQIRILFLAANPTATAPLDLNGEYEEIETTLRETSLTKSILLQHRWKLNREQLLDFFLQYRPHIVHFSGHGTEDNLILQDREGNAWPLDRKTAREAFKTTSNVTRLVVLNACYSRDVAEDISEVVDCVIGMSQPVYDNTAVKFAGSLYRGLGERLSVSDAFERARTELKVSGLPGANLPQIVSRPGLDPRRVFLMDWLQGEARPVTIKPSDVLPPPPPPRSRWWLVGGILALGLSGGAVIGRILILNPPRPKENLLRTDLGPPGPGPGSLDMARDITRDMKTPPDLSCPPGTTLQKGVCKNKDRPPPPVQPVTLVKERVWNLARDFSRENPSGEWEYGWAPYESSKFTRFTHIGDDKHYSSALLPTHRNKESLIPCVWKNTSGGKEFEVPSQQISLHPGLGYERSIVRWNYPGPMKCAGQVKIAGEFSIGNSANKAEQYTNKEQAPVPLQVQVLINGIQEWKKINKGRFSLDTPANTVKTVDFIVAVPQARKPVSSCDTVLDAMVTCTGTRNGG